MKAAKLLAVLIVTSAAYFAGYGSGRWYGVEPSAPAKQQRKILYWVDPMHPAYRSDKPGIAPDCNMPLEPVYEGEAPAAPGVVQVSAEKQQLIGVRYGTAEVTGGSETITAPGKVAFDERRVVNVHSKVDGWIEKVFVDFTGKQVDKGQPLVTVYSPEMLATQQELLLAARGEDKMRHSPISEAHEHARSLVAAARRRLELWDFSPEQMDAVLRTRQPVKTYTVFAPESGVVTSRNAYANQRITPDTNLYALTDMSRVSILADLYEHDSPRIQPGQHGRVKAAYGAGRAINARVDYVMPTYNGETRTLQVRLDAPNPGQWMKPGMFVEVEFPIALPRRLTVPTEAVLDTGRKQTVFVDLGEGRLKAQEVRTGDEFDGRTEILEGLKAGDRIVISGNFLLDSETQLKPAAPPPAEHKHHD